MILAGRPGFSILVRSLFAVFFLVVPLLFTSSPFESTFVTTWAIALAVRVADLEAFRQSQKPSPLEAWLWLAIPVLRSFNRTPEARARARRRARRYLLRSLVAGSSWVILEWALSPVLTVDSAWLLKSALLILFFALNFSAIADFAAGCVTLWGHEVDDVFRAPLLSTSPREFWSKRWNRYISRFALRHVALRLPRSWPAGFMIVAVFLTSGLFHEYFVWGVTNGWSASGLMMLFFFLQGVVVWIGSRLALRVPAWVGWSATFGWMTLTAPLFFRPVTTAVLSFGYPLAWLPW